MPEDVLFNQLVGELTQPQEHKTLQEQLIGVKRKIETKFLEDFVDYVTANFDPLGKIKDHIPKFLDERNKPE